jgi:hypothetical protein
VAARRVFITEGKGGHQRLIPVSGRFFTSIASYLDRERPAGAGTDRLFVVLKDPRRGRPLSPVGLDQILESARGRAGLGQATCSQLRHTCLTRLREAGMALESVQAQAGHASIESTRIYLHLAGDWLASQYRRAEAHHEASTAPQALREPSEPTPVDLDVDQGLVENPRNSRAVRRSASWGESWPMSNGTCAGWRPADANRPPARDDCPSWSSSTVRALSTDASISHPPTTRFGPVGETSEIDLSGLPEA